MSTLVVFVRANPTLNIPVIPANWELTVEDNRWSSIYPQGRTSPCFYARLIARAAGNPGRAVFVCVGPTGMLNRLATAIVGDGLPWTQTWSSLAALRADAQAVAVAVKGIWPDERQHTFQGAIGSRVDKGPVGVLVSLSCRMAGFDSLDGES